MSAIAKFTQAPADVLKEAYRRGLLLTPPEAAKAAGVNDKRIYAVMATRENYLPRLDLGFAILVHIEDVVARFASSPRLINPDGTRRDVGLQAYQHSPENYAAWLADNRKRKVTA